MSDSYTDGDFYAVKAVGTDAAPRKIGRSASMSDPTLCPTCEKLGKYVVELGLLAIGGEGETHFYYKDQWAVERKRVKELEDAIRKHRKRMYGNFRGVTEPIDGWLYAVLGEEK